MSEQLRPIGTLFRYASPFDWISSRGGFTVLTFEVVGHSKNGEMVECVDSRRFAPKDYWPFNLGFGRYEPIPPDELHEYLNEDLSQSANGER